MLGIEEILCELERGDGGGGSPLPPGFRFHPTDEELITFYLASKVFNGTFSGVDIAQVDLNRCEPWELPDVAKMGEREWYFFSLRDRKYPTGLRTNRATGAGYWKATGKDREVYSSTGSSGRGTSRSRSRSLLGMKKTLVFYKGRAPRGEKTKWVMHEYRLDGDFSYRHTCKEEWVICRIFHKMGEKKHGDGDGDGGGNIITHQGQSYHHQLREHQPPSPTTTNTNNSLPPLLESSTTPSLLLEPCNPFLFHHHESDLKSPSFPIFQTPPKDNTETNANPSPSIFKSLLSNQDFFTIPKQCKTEAIFSHPFPANLGGLDKTNHHHQFSHNPMLDFGVNSAMAFTDGGGTTATTHPIPWSSASALDKYGLHQMLLDMI